MKLRKSNLVLLIILSALVLSGLSGCATRDESMLSMAPINQMPAEVRSAPESVREAYQFAVANPEIIKHIPCYCGCGNIGHTSNYSCYISHADEQGNLTFDNHALGCSICVDITQDAMRLTREGKSVAEIKDYVDATYSKFGSSNMP